MKQEVKAEESESASGAGKRSATLWQNRASRQYLRHSRNCSGNYLRIKKLKRVRYAHSGKEAECNWSVEIYGEIFKLR